MTDADRAALKALQGQLFGNLVGIDALLRNAYVVAEAECALRLAGSIELTADAIGALTKINALIAAGLSQPKCQRYDLVQVNACYTTDHEMERADDGEWVRFEDVQSAGLSEAPAPQEKESAE